MIPTPKSHLSPHHDKSFFFSFCVSLVSQFLFLFPGFFFIFFPGRFSSISAASLFCSRRFPSFPLSTTVCLFLLWFQLQNPSSSPLDWISLLFSVLLFFTSLATCSIIFLYFSVFLFSRKLLASDHSPPLLHQPHHPFWPISQPKIVVFLQFFLHHFLTSSIQLPCAFFLLFSLFPSWLADCCFVSRPSARDGGIAVSHIGLPALTHEPLFLFS